MVKERHYKSSVKPEHKGMTWNRGFSAQGEDAFHTNYLGGRLEYESRTTEILDKEEIVFQQKDVEVPSIWSQNATNILSSKYCYGDKDKLGEREHSAKQVIGRVTKFISEKGTEQGYFASKEDAERFRDDLVVLMTNQAGMFNSPTLFNAGIYHEYGVESGSRGHYRWNHDLEQTVELNEGEFYKYPQPSACFIMGLKDDMDSITEVCKQISMLFKGGSGAGVDLSVLRSSYEKLSGGGKPSGPLSFAYIFDQIGAAIKSGGKTRRAAEMLSLLAEHPDIMKFIVAKKRQEELAHVLIDGGVDGSFGGEAYGAVKLQNANLSVRVTDNFMNAVINDEDWKVVPVKYKELADKINKELNYKARDLMRGIAEGTWFCGDPGVQFDTTINRWNTCPKSGRINASNPCSEYMFLDDSACNLASLNLVKFRKDDGSIDTKLFKKAVRTFFLAQEILVDPAGYPSQPIAQNSHDFRPLGLGYANLGGLLMSLGIPYDSDKGRAIGGALTAIMTAEAYQMSSKISEHVGHFSQFNKNKESMLEVMVMHENATENIDEQSLEEYGNLKKEAVTGWKQAISSGKKNGYRNAQATVLAPTGTIGFLMDCDTTGIEPDIALVKYKNLSGGGQMKIVNQIVPVGLEKLGYDKKQIKEIIDYISDRDTIEGAPHLKKEHLPVFDCAFKPENGERFIHYMGHLKMMAAAQPFLSGAISKTVNVPNNTSVEEIEKLYVESWKMGLKAVAVYRDDSKRTQPLNTRDVEGGLAGRLGMTPPKRLKLPQTRISATHKFEIGSHGSYLHMGMYDNGTLGEIFLDSGEEGSEVRGFADAWATSFSLLLQTGYSLESLSDKFSKMSFPPSGMLMNGERKGLLDQEDSRGPIAAKSIVSYVMGHLRKNFLNDKGEEVPYKPYIKLGLFGNSINKSLNKGSKKSKIREKEEIEKELDGNREELLKKANDECPICHGPGIKKGKCDVLCLGSHGLVKGTCGGDY